MACIHLLDRSRTTAHGLQQSACQQPLRIDIGEICDALDIKAAESSAEVLSHHKNIARAQARPRIVALIDQPFRKASLSSVRPGMMERISTLTTSITMGKPMRLTTNIVVSGAVRWLGSLMYVNDRKVK